MKEILLYAGAVLYAANYITGWLLYFRRIRMGKRQHQILFGSILLVMIALIPFMYGSGNAFVMLLISIIMMAVLPFGRKGGAYHIIVSTIGLISFAMIFIV